MSTDVERAIAELEARLAALGAALRSPQADALQDEAADLQRALVAALEPVRHSADTGLLTPPLRQRLVDAAGRMAAQRDALARAGGALDRALNLLLPAAASSVGYSADGLTQRQKRSGWAQA